MSYTLNYRFPKLVHIVSEAIHYLVSTFFYRVLFFQKTLAAWNPKIDTNFFYAWLIASHCGGCESVGLHVLLKFEQLQSWALTFHKIEWFYLLQWKVLKMMQNDFYFTLKALFVLKIFKFLSRHFWSCRKTAS